MNIEWKYKIEVANTDVLAEIEKNDIFLFRMS